jgi:divalent metal cation (Fe/Co/Zn/Cd) transporter
MRPASAQPEQATLRAARIAVAANAVLMAVQIATGWLTGSQAIVADGIHTLVDLAIDALLFFTLRPAGMALLARAGALGAAFPSVAAATLLTLTGAELIRQGLAEAGSAATAPASAQFGGLVVALLVLGTREAVARYLHAVAARVDVTHARAADTLTASAWHARADAMSAGAAAIGALGTMAGLAHLDQFATLLIGTMMLGMGLFQQDGLIRRYCRRMWARPA